MYAPAIPHTLFLSPTRAERGLRLDLSASSLRAACSLNLCRYAGECMCACVYACVLVPASPYRGIR